MGVHVYRKLLPHGESTSNWKTSGLSSYWKGKEKRSIKMKDDYEALKRRDQEEDILLKIGQKMRELKMKQIEDNIQSQEILVEGLKKKYASMWKDEEGMEKKLDMGMKLAVETEPGKPNEEDPFAKVPTSMATYRNFEDVMDEKFRRLMGDFGELTVERRRLAWGGKKLKSGDEQEGMAGKGGFIGYSSGYRYRTRRAPRHGTIGYNVDSYYDVYVDDYFDEDVEPAPEPEPAASSSAPVEQPVDPNLFAQDFIDGVPAVVDPATTFKEEEFEHLEWDKAVVVVENTYKEPEPPTEPLPAPELTAEQGLYVTVGADGSLVSADGAVFAVLANGCLKGADGAVFAPTGVILAVDNTLANAGIAFEGSVALADGVKLEEGRKFVIKQQHLAEGETLLSFLGGAEFVDGAGRLFRRAADGTFLGADLDNLEAWTYSGCALTAKDSTKLEGEMLQGASEWKWVVNGVELERGAKIAVKPKSKADGDVLLLKSDGSLVDGAGGVYSISPEGLLVGPEGVIFGATGQYMTPAGVAQNANVTFADGAVLANGNGVSAGSKIVVKKQSLHKSDGDFLIVNSAGKLVDGAGKEFSVRPDGVLTGPDGVVFGATGAVITAAGMSENAALSYGDGAVMANGKNLATGAKILVKKQISADEGLVLLVGADGSLSDLAGKKYTMRSDGKLVSEDTKKVHKSTGKVVTAEQKVITNANASVDESGKVTINGEAAKAGAKIVIHQKEEEEEQLEPPPKPVTIKGQVTLKDSKGEVFAEVNKDDAAGTVIGAESVIIIKNAKGKEVVRITRGYVTVKNFNVEEIVQIMRGVVSVKTMAGKEMVHVEKGEIYIEDFDGEVIVNSLADVNKLGDGYN